MDSVVIAADEIEQTFAAITEAKQLVLRLKEATCLA